MKKKLALILVLSMMLTLCGCAVEGPAESSASASYVPGSITAKAEEEAPQQEAAAEETAAQETPRQVFSNEAGTSLDVLREEISATSAVFGVTYLGYRDSSDDSDLHSWLQSAVAELKDYPFMAELDDMHVIGTAGHLYCIVPLDDDASLTVVREDEVLYSSMVGDPILLFANLDGYVQTLDTLVTLTVSSGDTYEWQPCLDTAGWPELLMGDERELLSYAFTAILDDGFDYEGWKAEGWTGVLPESLDGTIWRTTTWDGSLTHRLFFISEDRTELMCIYPGEDVKQALWEGNWQIETELDKPGRLHLTLELTDGMDMEAYMDAATVSETYLAMISASGEKMLLVKEGEQSLLHMFPDGVEAVELTLEQY